ncbi:hypothetical protein FF1_029088 [Malus domestica]
MEPLNQKSLERAISHKALQMGSSFACQICEVGFLCGVCLTFLFLVALTSLGTFEYGGLSFSSISDGNSSSEFIKVFGIGTSSSYSPSAAGGNEMIARGTGSKSLNLYSAINQALHIALETDPRK